jgi:hypothetical protein
MSALPLPLERLQRFMLGVIVHPGPVEEAFGTASARKTVPKGRLGDVILPSATLAPEERLAIYHMQYPLRMRDALASDYPGLEHFLGEEGFARFVADYVRVHPSRSYTLNRLGDHVPRFIASRRRLTHREFLHDLARLERAVVEAFDAEETARLDDAAIAAIPPDAWGGARLVPIAALRLLTLGWNANAYLDTVRDESHDHPRPRKKAGCVAVYRRNYGVFRLELAPPAYALLKDLAAGKRLGNALAAASRRGGRPPSEDQLFRWFREWVSAGIFARVDLS